MTTTKLLSLTLLLAATMGVCGVSSAEEAKDSTSTEIVSVEDSDLRNEEALRVAVGDFDDEEFLLSADEMATIANSADVSFNDISAQGGEGSGSSMFSAEASERVETTQSASSTFNGALTLASATSETVTVRQSAVATTSLSFDDSTEQYAEELPPLDKGRDGVGTLISSDDSSVSKETVSFLGNFDSVSDTDGSYGISYLNGDIVYLTAYSYTWNGTENANTWNTDSSNKNWVDGGSYGWDNTGRNDSNAIFDGGGYSTVIVGDSIVATNLTVNGGGEYTFEYNDGASLTASGNVTIGNSSGAGSLTITGGTNKFTSTIYVGYGNTGLLTITDGKNTFGAADSTIYIGDHASSGSATTGTLKITGGEENTFSAGTIRLGNNSGDKGTIEITGGKVDFKLSSAQSGVFTTIYVGYSGTGEIIIGSLDDDTDGPNVTFQAGSEANTKLYLGFTSTTSSGKITINSGTTDFYSSVDLYVGGGGSTEGAIEINGGTTTFDTAVYLGYGTGSKGTLTITGGNNTFKKDVYIGYANGSNSTLEISGGTNTFGTIYVGRVEGTTQAKGTMEVTNGYTTVKTLSNVAGSTTTVSGGTLVVDYLEQNHDSKLEISGTGAVEITTGTSGADGVGIYASGNGKLILDVAVTAGEGGDKGSGLTIGFKDNSTLVIQGDLLAAIESAGKGVYVDILQAEYIYFGEEYISMYTGEVSDYDDLINSYVYAGGLVLTWKYDSENHILSAAIAPEPSMFGLMLGLGAIGLVATRRRQRAA